VRVQQNGILEKGAYLFANYHGAEIEGWKVRFFFCNAQKKAYLISAVMLQALPKVGLPTRIFMYAKKPMDPANQKLITAVWESHSTLSLFKITAVHMLPKQTMIENNAAHIMKRLASLGRNNV